MSEECGVQVGVRIRPFNQREKDLNAKLCVEMEGPMTILNPPPEAAQDDVGRKIEQKKFTFDASFWSHDGFDAQPNGYCTAKPGSNYADQQMVFEKFGKLVLDNAWAGYHCCLFAYGQTGAGKSYSMVGYGANRGIVPISCEEIFRRIENNADPDLKFEVMVSMVEIYNEQVQDLLIKAKDRPKKGLEVRESKQLGIYIDGVIKRAVTNYKSIEAAVDEGTENRTVGSTLMNATSSRAHTVLIIEFAQLSNAGGQTGRKVSMINLVDLAGSEKAGQTGASGDRLKEGCAINKSLSALGNVIEKLADKAEKKGKQVLIPYRDSKLTRLLQNALGGSSKTVMICAISPASSNHEETLSTLRYADRAKRIKNAAVVNENPADKLIRQLREENAKLRSMLSGEENTSSPQASAESAEEMQRKKAEIATLEQALQNMQASFEEQLAQARQQAALEAQAARAQEQAANAEQALRQRSKERAEQEGRPHIANLNEDQLLTNKLRFAFKEGRTRIGRTPAGGEGEVDAPEVCLAGPGILQEHAYMESAGERCVLFAHELAAANTFVNGKNPAQSGRVGIELEHGDRVGFGQLLFVFVKPSKGKADELIESGQVSFSQARKETAGCEEGEELEELKASRLKAAELEQRMKEAEDAKSAAQAEADMLVRQREEEFRQQMEALQREFEAKEAQIKALTPRAAAAEQPVPQDPCLATTPRTFAAMTDEERAFAREQEEERARIRREEQARAHAQELERMQYEFAERQRSAEESAHRQIQNLEKQAQKAAAEQEDLRQRELMLRKLEEDLVVAMPLVKEANLIATELGRPHRFETKMQLDFLGERGRGQIGVAATVSRDGARVYEWPLETLENRIFLMRELLEQAEDDPGIVARVSDSEQDPFWDPVQVERQIGMAQASLQGLLMQVENQHDCRLLSTEVFGLGGLRQDADRGRAKNQVGTLHVEIWPCSADGKPGVPEEDLVDKPEELVGSKMVVLVQVVRATGLPEELANDVRVEFDFFIDEAPHEVPPALGHNCAPEFKYSRMFVQDPVTSRFVNYCEKKVLVFRVFGVDPAAKAHAEAMQSLVMAREAAAEPDDDRLPTPDESDEERSLDRPSEPPPHFPPPVADSSAMGLGGLGELPTLPSAPAAAPPETAENPGVLPELPQWSPGSPPSQSVTPGHELPPQEVAQSVPTPSQVRRETESILSEGGAQHQYGQPKSKACAIL